jgi:transposase
LDHATTILFDLPGVRVRHVERNECGGRVVHVETADRSALGCPGCGVVSTSVKQYVTSTPRDRPYGERGISLVWHKRRWRCVEHQLTPSEAVVIAQLYQALHSFLGDAAVETESSADIGGRWAQ